MSSSRSPAGRPLAGVRKERVKAEIAFQTERMLMAHNAYC